MQLRNYINTPIPRVGYSLKLAGPLGDIEAHNVARAPQDTLVTPEVGKFADILGVTVLYEIVNPDDLRCRSCSGSLARSQPSYPSQPRAPT
jgi:hypothetical protein